MPSDEESFVQEGLSALKQGDYKKAIALLEPVASSQTTGKLQAQVGLVMAYARSGEAALAIALCDSLIQSHNPQVQEWAKRALTHLTKRDKGDRESKNQDDKNYVTGFVPFDNSRLEPPPVTAEANPPSSAPEKLESQSAVIPSSAPEKSDAIVPVSGEEGKIPSKINWRQAGRAKAWQPLAKINLIPLRLLALGTFIALFWVTREIFKLASGLINGVLVKLPFFEPFQLLYADHTVLLLLGLIILLAVSPFLLDRLVADIYGGRQLHIDALNMSSREAVRVLQRYCQQRGWQVPKLSILPIMAPLAFSYGNLPRTARIVVTQGLLDQLADEEIATIYASQLGHIAHWDFVVMSVLLLVTLPIYKLYQLMSEWGNKTSNPVWRAFVTILASLAYAIWCVLTGTGLWLSQLRIYYSDRLAAEITGNPNGLIRALLKIAIGVANEIQKQQQTPWQIESLNLLAPVSHQQSVSLGSIAGHISFESFLMWDTLNPDSRWFTINNSHPLIGLRIQRLSEIAKNWHLDSEIHLPLGQSLKLKRQSFFLQIAPFLGIPLGLVLGGLIWLIWQTAFALKVLNLKWIYDDSSFITGCILIGFSIGIMMRINAIFPDIKSDAVQTDKSLPNLLANPSALPIDSITVRLVGKLLGRRGTSNSLGQDLILECGTMMVKLHHVSWLGHSVNPQDLIGRKVTVTGWFRRGATSWIDIQTLKTQNGKIINSPHPIWSTVLAVASLTWGAYILLTG